MDHNTEVMRLKGIKTGTEQIAMRLSAVSVQDGGVFERGPKICSFST